MGIPGFSTWCQKQHPSAYLPISDALPFDHVYIDMASILHTVLRRARTKAEFHRQLHREITEMLVLTQPRRNVTLALDGPAPLAKLLTQRQRRQIQARRDARLAEEAASSGTTCRGVSRSALTPGSPLMLEIESSLSFFVCRALQGTSFGHLHFEITGSTVPGEGEVKILERLINPWPSSGSGSGSGGSTSHVIVGGDSDIVLLALVGVGLMPQQPAVYIMSDARPARGPRMVLSVPALQQLWSTCASLATAAADFPGGRTSFLQALAEDLTVASMLGSGNDYLPAVRGLPQLVPVRGGSAGLWDAYLKMRASPAWAHRSLVCTGPGGDTQLDGEFVEALMKSGSLGSRPSNDWQRPKAAAPVAPTDTSEDQSSPATADGPNELLPAYPAQYLQGVLWVLKMYRTGCCGDYWFTYECFPPACEPLLKAIAAQAAQPLSVPPAVSRQLRAPLLPAACALALMPRSASAHAPTALRHLMQAGSPIGDLFDSCDECKRLQAEQLNITWSLERANMRLPASLRSSRRRDARGRSAPRAVVPSKAGQTLAAPAQQLVVPVTPSNGISSGSSLADLVAKVEQLRKKSSVISRKRVVHQRRQHPYQSFPLERMMAAVAEVPLSAYPEAERALASFGTPLRFRGALSVPTLSLAEPDRASTEHMAPSDAGEAPSPAATPDCTPSCRRTNGDEGPSKRFSVPQPPAPSGATMRPLQTPLCISRDVWPLNSGADSEEGNEPEQRSLLAPVEGTTTSVAELQPSRAQAGAGAGRQIAVSAAGFGTGRGGRLETVAAKRREFVLGAATRTWRAKVGTKAAASAVVAVAAAFGGARARSAGSRSTGSASAEGKASEALIGELCAARWLGAVLQQGALARAPLGSMPQRTLRLPSRQQETVVRGSCSLAALLSRRSNLVGCRPALGARSTLTIQRGVCRVLA